MTLATIREAVLDHWTPALAGQAGDRRADPRLEQVWDELRAVGNAGAWSSTIVQAGRLLEHVLRVAAVEAGSIGYSQAAKKSTYELLALLPTRDAERPMAVNRVALDTVRRLRNLSAHLATNSEAPDELAATQSLVALVMFIEMLTPRTRPQNYVYTNCSSRDALWMRDNWQKTAPTAVGKWLFKASVPDADLVLCGQHDAVFHHGLKGGIGALKWTAEAALHSPRFGPEFAGFVEEHIAQIFTMAAHTSALQLRKFVRPLRPLGLRELDRVLRVMMPYDEAWLEESMLVRSPAWLAWTVRRWRRSNREQWSRLASSSRLEALATAAWTRWDGSWSFVSNRFVLAQNLPGPLRRRVITAAPDDALTVWFAEATPIRALPVAITCLRDALVTDERRDLVSAAYFRRLAAATVSDVRSVPAVLRQLGASRGLFGQSILSHCLLKEPDDDEWQQTVHLLWTSWAVSTPVRVSVADRARQLAHYRNPSLGERLALLGLGELADTVHGLTHPAPTIVIDASDGSQLASWASARPQTVVLLAALALATLYRDSAFLNSLGRELRGIAEALPGESSGFPGLKELKDAVDSCFKLGTA